MKKPTLRRLLAEICRWFGFAVLISILVSFVVIGEDYHAYRGDYGMFLTAFVLSIALVIVSYVLHPAFLHPLLPRRDDSKDGHKK